jgi:hypothetical protein
VACYRANFTFVFYLKEHNGRAWTGLIWLRIQTNGRVLRTQCGNFGFCKIQGISSLTGKLLASQEGFYSMKPVS